jgi:hypothetical protein
VGLRNLSGRFGEEKNLFPLPGFVCRNMQPVALSSHRLNSLGTDTNIRVKQNSCFAQEFSSVTKHCDVMQDFYMRVSNEFMRNCSKIWIVLGLIKHVDVCH